jgi:hypothetical protein
MTMKTEVLDVAGDCRSKSYHLWSCVLRMSLLCGISSTARDVFIRVKILKESTVKNKHTNKQTNKKNHHVHMELFVNHTTCRYLYIFQFIGSIGPVVHASLRNQEVAS